MGNGASSTINAKAMGKRWRKGKPRVVLESPPQSMTDNTKTTRVSFADRRSGLPVFNSRPQMTDIGKVGSDIEGRKVKFTRSQVAGTSNGSVTEMQTSLTSIRSTGSIPIDGIWEPTLNPYERRVGEADSTCNCNNYYKGFDQDDIGRTRRGLASVAEL